MARDDARGVTFAILTVLLGCASGEEREAVGRARQALSTPRRAFPPSAAETRAVPSVTAWYALDAGLVYFAPEPFFVDGRSPPASLGDLLPGPFTTGTLTSINGAVIDDELHFAQQPQNSAFRTAWKTNGTLAGTGVALSGAPRIERVVGGSPLGALYEASVAGSPIGTARAIGGVLGEVFVRATGATGFLEVDGGALFLAQASRHDLFFSDGTDAGTQNLTAGRADISSVASVSLVPYAGRAWFVGIDGRTGLWMSDGTRAGTVAAPVVMRNVTSVTPGLGRLLLVGELGGSGKFLVSSDGSDAGLTVLHGTPPQQSTDTQVLGVTTTHAFFSINRGQALWASDGTPAGTVQVAAAVSTGTVSGGRFFFASMGAPWVSDGTLAGTHQLSTSATAAEAFDALPGSRVSFFASTTAEGHEPWASDGTIAGTAQIASLVQGSSGGVAVGVKHLGDGRRVWFECVGGICVTDGTDGGTRLATPPASSYRPEGVQWLSAIGGNLVFRSGASTLFADPSGSGRTLITRASTVPPTLGPDGTGWFIAGSTLAGQPGFFLWRTGGTATSTGIVAAPDGGFPSSASIYAVSEDTVFVRTSVSSDALYAYRPDASLEVLSEFTPNPSSVTGPPAVLGNELFFTTTLADGGLFRLVRSDGTAAGTRLVDGVATAQDLVAANGALWFTHSTLQVGIGLARFDPATGTITRLLPGFTSARFQAAGSTLYVVQTELQGTTLYRTDGTDAGTTLLATFSQSTIPRWLSWGEGAAFVVFARNGTNSVGVTDGTPSGTRLLPGVVTEVDFSGFPVLTNALPTDAGLFLGAWTLSTGLEPAALAMDAMNPLSLGDVLPGPESSWPRSPVRLGEAIYFIANDPVGDAIFVTDLHGTPTGGGSAAGGGAVVGGGTSGGGSAGGGAAGGMNGAGGEAMSAGGTVSASGGTSGGEAEMPPPASSCGCSGAGGTASLVVLLARRLRRKGRS